MGHVVSQGAFPVVLGGDHSIGYPTIRGLAPYVDGNIGIIHFDRHVDTQELDLDERMHTTPWFHATNIANARHLRHGSGGVLTAVRLGRADVADLGQDPRRPGRHGRSRPPRPEAGRLPYGCVGTLPGGRLLGSPGGDLLGPISVSPAC
jgi:hypothetical protein